MTHIEEAFYEAAIIPELWEKAVNTASEAWNTDAVAIARFSGACSGLVASQKAEQLAARYISEGWYKSDIRAERAIPALRKGKEIVTEADLFRASELQGLPFYSDFLRKSGFGCFAASLLYEMNGIILSLSVERFHRNGPFTQEDLSSIERQLPHIRKACELASISRLAAAEETVLNFEQLRYGAILLDWLGRVIRVNKTAEAHIDTSLHVTMSRLQLSDKEANETFQAFITEGTRPIFSDASKPVEPLVVHRPGKRPLVLSAYPVIRHAFDVCQGARAILVIKDPEETLVISRKVSKEAFRFTPTEHRVASLLLDGFSTDRIAAELNVSKEAIRFHLKSVFAKTGTNQQAQLVSLLSRFGETREPCTYPITS